MPEVKNEVKSMHDLSKEDRQAIFDALWTKQAVLKRAVNSEKDPEIRALRERSLDRIIGLSNRFFSAS